MSLSVIAAAAAAVVGGTGAFFSDTETSTGNTFTAGAIDLQVDSQQRYNNAVCVDRVWVLADSGSEPDVNQYPVLGSACGGTWEMKDLEPTIDKFFNFGDVKPGDSGENTISLHVINNDAYACVDITGLEDEDNSQTEPETQAVLDTDDMESGELAEGLNFFAWNDDGDNVFEGSANPGFPEVPLFSNVVGPASDVLGGKTYTLASPSTNPLPGGSTSYIGIAWCAGALTPTSLVDGGWTCDGDSLGNEAQTDSVSADISFRVEQARNNPSFSCTPVVELPNDDITD